MMDSLKQKKNVVKKIRLGTKVVITINGQKQSWKIVRTEQSDISNGKISNNAPLVQLIWEKEEGEVVEGKIGNRYVSIKIGRISDMG